MGGRLVQIILIALGLASSALSTLVLANGATYCHGKIIVSGVPGAEAYEPKCRIEVIID